MTSDVDTTPVPDPDEAADPVRTDAPDTTSDGNEAVVVLAGEQLRAGTEWVESGRVRLRRRIVTEVRTVEVVVRREELIVETHDVAPGAVGESYRGTALDGPAVPGPAVPGLAEAASSVPRPAEQPTAQVVVPLREEVPEIVLRPHVYEQVTANLVRVDEIAVVHDTARHEEADYSTE